MSWGLIKSLRIFLILFLLSACQNGSHQQAAVLYAASSLSRLEGPIKKLVPFKLNIEFHSSSHIAHQLKLGVGCDAIIITDEEWKNYLLKHQLIDPDIKVIARNRLVIAKHQKDALSLSSIDVANRTEKIIFADPDFVPLGRFSKTAFVNQGIYEKITKRLVTAHSAESAVMLLKKGVAPYAILYASDVDEKEVFLSKSIDEHLHPPIEYYLATCRIKSSNLNNNLKMHLLSMSFQQIIKQFGFRGSHE